nr:hypothetical protein Iba_chr10eCG10570 [Ipomoea batatas]
MKEVKEELVAFWNESLQTLRNLEEKLALLMGEISKRVEMETHASTSRVLEVVTFGNNIGGEKEGDDEIIGDVKRKGGVENKSGDKNKSGKEECEKKGAIKACEIATFGNNVEGDMVENEMEEGVENEIAEEKRGNEKSVVDKCALND